jgi:kumamolisin
MEQMRENLRTEYDFILIDSRTGVSDTSGICTVQMPDTVVVCFTLNFQSIDGASAVAHSIVEQRTRQGKPVRIFPVPMRVELSAEKIKYEQVSSYALRRFLPTDAEQAVLAGIPARTYWDDVAVPYIGFYVFEEQLAWFVDLNRTLAAIIRLARYVASVDALSLRGPDEGERKEVLAQYAAAWAERRRIQTMSTDHKAINGSDRAALHGAHVVGPIPADERFEVTVRVRRKASLASLAVSGFHADQAPQKRNYLTREQHATNYGADPADIANVEAFAKAHGLVVVESSPARRSVFLSGTAANFAKAFGTTIDLYEHDGGTYRGRTGVLTVPTELQPIVEGVFGIDNRPVAKPHFQISKTSNGGIRPHAAGSSFSPPELTKLYNFPSGVDGSGQCIAILELGGGYRAADIKAYFNEIGLPVPHVVTLRVDGGTSHPSTPDSADGEVMLDIEVAAAIAPKAKIAVYFAPNTDKGFLDALTMAIHDTTNKASVISIGWGGPESNWTAQAMNSFDQALQTAATLGVTVCCASGDNGSGNGVDDGKAHVDFPASSPFALACGGTKLTAAGTNISSEVVWNESADSATGGGVSDFFPVPDYQSATGVPGSANPGSKRGRGVPDVAGHADPATGYRVRVNGQEFVIGGTCAVAPLLAGLIALMNQKLGHPVGFLNPLIYGTLVGKGCFQDIISGTNGAYAAKSGWDACTGWGSPNGTKLLNALGSTNAVGA